MVYPNYLDELKKVRLEFEKIKARRRRYNRYIKEMSESYKNLFLLSLTFSDEVMTRTSFQTRKDYVRQWLNKNSVDYFACVDYGKENGREHYHAIVALDLPLEEIEIKRRKFYRVPEQTAWKYGFYSLRRVQNSDKDRRKTTYYAFKASDYAFKNADKTDVAKPFHKRGVTHWICVDGTEEDLPF